MKVGFVGLTENIVYVHRFRDDPRRLPDKRLVAASEESQPRKSLQSSFDEVLTQKKILGLLGIKIDHRRSHFQRRVSSI